MAAIDPRTGQAAAQAVRTAYPVSASPGAIEGIGAALAADKPPASTTTAGTKEKLTAIATGGAAGLKNLQSSQDFLQAQRTMALQRAGQRSAIIGGPEAQGFESYTEGEFARRSADIAAADRTASTAGGMRQAAIANYRKALQAGIPANFAFGKAKGEKEAAAAAAKANKEDFVSKALGQAEIDEKTAAARLADLDSQTAGINTPLQEAKGKLAELDAQQKALESEMKAVGSSFQGGITGGLKALSSLLPGGQKALTNDKAVAEQRAKYERLRTERDRIANEKGRLSFQIGQDEKSGQTRLDALAAQREQFTAFSPETRADRAREIAIRQMNVDPALATGKIGVEDVKSRLPKPGASDAAVMSKANLSMDELVAAKEKPEYVENAELLALGISSMSKEKALQLINTIEDPQVRAVLRAQFEGEYLTAAQLKSAAK
jgi:hypothetical protein